MSGYIPRFLQRPIRLGLRFGVAVTVLATAGCVHERPRFNQIQFAMQTGSSALDRGSVATATLRSKHGRVRQQVTLKAVNQPDWKANTTHTAKFTLKPRVDFCDIRSVDITLQPSTGSNAGKAWTIQKAAATLSIDNVDQTDMFSDAGSPLAQLTVQQPTLPVTVPCRKQPPLYERLGKKPGIRAVVDDFVVQLEQDHRISQYFMPIANDHKRLHEFNEKMMAKMCELSGGPCRARDGGKSPLAGVGSTLTDFRAVVDDLIAAMAKFPSTASVKDKNELLGAPLLSESGPQQALRKKAAPAPAGPMTQVVSSPITSPQFVNLYWDAMWDADNTTVPMEAFDSFTQAVIGSSYFAGLSEYGIGMPSWGGSFLPSHGCTAKPPNSTVGFYDPVNPSIIGFLQCQLDSGVVQSDNTIYNIMLPQGVTESDSFGNALGFSSPECVGGGATAWHFHGTPYSVGEFLGGLLGGIIGAYAGDPAEGALVGFLIALSQQGGPYYTISSASSMPLNCGNFPHNVLHEMVEATSDPSPGLFVLMNPMTSEIVDICDNMGATDSASWDPTSLPTGVTLTPGGFLASQVPQYWSNGMQTCLKGFGDTTQPNVQTVAVSGSFPATSLTITGSGFGAAPSLVSFSIPTSANLPYFGVQDTTASPAWQAGNSLNSNAVGVTVTSWADNSVTVSGFSAPDSSTVMQASDNIVAWVCNPSSGLCGANQGTANAGGSCGGAGNPCCPSGHAACNGACCASASDICDPNTNSCALACPGGGCAAGQLCCIGSNGGLMCANPVPRAGLTWCGEMNPNQIYCNNCPSNQQCLSILSGGIMSDELYCQ